MKEIVNVSNSGDYFKLREVLTTVFLHVLVLVCGLISTKGIVMDKLLPFGISMVAGTSLTYTPTCAIGVFLGYFFTAVGSGGFKYLAAIFAVISIKLLLGNYKRLVSNSVFLCFITLLVGFFTNVAALKVSGGSMVETVSEAVLATIGTYFVNRTFKIFLRQKSGLSPEELSSLLIFVTILLLGLKNTGTLGVSLGRIMSVLLILISSKYGGIIAGAISGITVALTSVLGGTYGNIGVIFAAEGLFCGVFSSLGKYAQVIIALILGFIGAVSTGDVSQIPIIATETVLGCALFVVMPRSSGVFLGKIFSAYPKVLVPTGFKKSVTMRLQLASHALKDVSQTVEQVANELSKINSPDFTNVINAIEQDACAGCKLRIHCWEKKREATLCAVLEMTKAIKQGEINPESAAPDEFKGRCVRIGSVSNAAYKRYTDYAAKISAENRIDEVRSVVSDQFDGMSAMLSELANDFELQERFDNSAAENAAAVLRNINIHIEECSSRVDRYGRMTIELRLKKTPDLIINKAQVMKLVSVACERDFDVPTVNEIGGEVYISLNERAEIMVDVGVCQSSANDNALCGDAYKYFSDQKGHFVMILSDGMGTGGRAAVDGAMASGLMARLLKAGFGFNCSLKILNSSMLFKSTDESLATVDIASVDLFTGMTELYKAGAAPTIVRRSGKTGKAESNSLPAGILRDIGFDKAVIRCKIGDIIVLLSDGAVSDGTDWIRAEIEAWREGTAQELSDHLCLCAKRRRSEKRQDDITVMCAILNKAV